MLRKDMKSNLIFLFSIIIYLISSVSCLLCTKITSNKFGVIIGFGFMVLALISHFIGKSVLSTFYTISCMLNSLSIGFTIGAYFASTGTELNLTTVLVILVPYALFIYLICTLVTKSKNKKVCGMLIGLGLLCLIVLCIIYWSEGTLFSYGFFQLIVVFFFLLLALKTLKTPSNILSDLSLFSFGIYIVVAAIVIIILSDGDAADVLIDFVDIRKKKKK